MRIYVFSSGDFTATEQRNYAHQRSAERYAREHGLTIVGSHPASDPTPPSSASAQEWDDHRTRNGYAGGR